MDGERLEAEGVEGADCDGDVGRGSGPFPTGLVVPKRRRLVSGEEFSRSRLGLDELAHQRRQRRGYDVGDGLKSRKGHWADHGSIEGGQQHRNVKDVLDSRKQTPVLAGLMATSGQSSWDEDSLGIPARSSGVRDTPMTERLPRWDDSDFAEAYRAEEDRLDREWYLQDEDSGAGRVEGNQVSDAAWTGVEERFAARQASRLSARAVALHEDASRWEAVQMRVAGRLPALIMNDADLDEETGPRIALLVKDVGPRFLDGRVARAVEAATVVPIKDPTSDLAVVARRGSGAVKARREARDRAASRVKYWELGTAFGALQKSKDEEVAEREALAASVAAQRDESAKAPTATYAAALATARVGPGDRGPLSANRTLLPVFAVREALLQVIRENQVVVIVGETGSGKTTQLTQYLVEDGYCVHGKIVACTQPRRVAAVSVAQRVADEMQVPLGREVGYAIRFEDNTTDGVTIIKYMTDGILLRETLSDRDLEKYSCVVMDEAHERSLNTDVLLGVIRDVMRRRVDLRVIVTSATMNAEKFAEFFGSCPVFTIPGRTFPVDQFYAKNPVEDYVEGAVRQVLQVHIQAPVPGDILVFMTGQEDIEATCEILAEKITKLEAPRPVLILPIYSQLASDLQAKIFEKAPDGVRKVVIATNIAETSLTLDGVTFVVDSGFCKLKTYNPKLGMDALLMCPISQASARQRAGRAGRTAPGKCYRLYTASAFANEMLESSVPEIQRTNLSHVVLMLKSIGVSNVLEFAFMDAPPEENIIKSMFSLWTLGALCDAGHLTDLGRKMAAFPLDPPLAALLLAGERLGCSAEIVTIVAMLSVPSVFVRPRGKEEESDSSREKFMVAESDHLTLLHVFQRWRAGGSREEWCNRHFINGKSMRRSQEVRDQLLETMKVEGFYIKSCGTDWDLVRKALCCPYVTQCARRKGLGEYINLRSGVVSKVHPTSALYGLGFMPDYVVYHELIYTQQEYLSCVSAVEPKWMFETAPKLFAIKEGGSVVDVKGEESSPQQAEKVESLEVTFPEKKPRPPAFAVLGQRARTRKISRFGL